MPLNQAKRVWLADDDPALSPAKLKARLKERAKAARKKERNKLALGLPGEDPPRSGCRTSVAMRAVAPHAAQNGGKRKAGEALDDASWSTMVTLLQIELHAAMGAEKEAAAAAEKEAAAEKAAAEKVAAETVVAAVDAMAEAAVEQAAAEAAAAEIEAAIEVEAEKAAAEAAIEQAAAEQAAAEAAAVAAERQAAKEQRVAKKLAADRGFVEAPPLIPKLRVRSLERCPICLEDEEDSNPPDSSMPCCHAHIHLACFMKWHAQAQQGPSVRGPNRHGGSKLIPMETCHLCVLCKAKHGTARGPPRVRQLE
jgi:hypothetical protein